MRLLPNSPQDFAFVSAWANLLLPFLALWAQRLAAKIRAGTRAPTRWWRRAPTVLLLLLAVGTTTSYVGRNNRAHPHGVQGYDTFHYYPGAKYRAELGTELLYFCALVADLELDHPRFNEVKRYRDLKTYRVLSKKKRRIRADKSRCKDRFTPERWTEFKKDIRYFQKITSSRTWRRVFIDRGTNASPVWHLFGGSVARLVPTSHLSWATQLDWVMLAIALGFIAWAFGLDVAAVAMIFFTASVPTRWPHIGAVLFRYDWVAALAIAISLIKKDRWAWAGAAIAYAAGVRLFPIIIIGGLGGRALWRIATERRLLRSEWRLLFGFFTATALFWTAAAIDGGLPAIQEFAAKISTHTAPENVSVMRVGLQIALAFEGELSSAKYQGYKVLTRKRKIIKEQAPWHRVFVLLLILLVIAISRRLDDDEALLMGFAMFPLVLQASYYYYAFALVPFVLHAVNLARRPHYFLFAFLCLLNAFGHFALGNKVTRYVILAPGSVLVVIYCACCLALLAWTSHARHRRGLADLGRVTDPGER